MLNPPNSRIRRFFPPPFNKSLIRIPSLRAQNFNNRYERLNTYRENDPRELIISSKRRINYARELLFRRPLPPTLRAHTSQILHFQRLNSLAKANNLDRVHSDTGARFSHHYPVTPPIIGKSACYISSRRGRPPNRSRGNETERVSLHPRLTHAIAYANLTIFISLPFAQCDHYLFVCLTETPPTPRTAHVSTCQRAHIYHTDLI